MDFKAPEQQQPSGLSEQDQIYTQILELTNPVTREQALLELSKKRDSYEDLAPILWHSFGRKLKIYKGVMAALLQEIVSVYPLLTPPTLTGHSSNRVCNALALLQLVASHQETRGFFLSGFTLNLTKSTYPSIFISISEYHKQD